MEEEISHSNENTARKISPNLFFIEYSFDKIKVLLKTAKLGSHYHKIIVSYGLKNKKKMPNFILVLNISVEGNAQLIKILMT